MEAQLPVVAKARATRTVVASSRRRRRVTVAEAHRIRRRARELRLRTSAAREDALEQYWELWLRRMVAKAPTYVPLAWDRPPRDDRAVLLVTARACEDVAAAARLALEADPAEDDREALVLTAALADVAAARMRSDREDAWVAVAGTARLLEQLDESFGSPGDFRDRAVLIVACRSALRTLRYSLARFHGTIEP